MPPNIWDPAEYDDRFGFVTRGGDDLIDVLDARAGERILDLGCGTGHHAARIAETGAHVVGVDLDAAMIAAARAAHPQVRFEAADATALTLTNLGPERPFEGCFSNAALHWMVPQNAVLASVRGCLAEGARFVAEMGGAGNIAALDWALRRALADLGLADVPVPTNYFPTVGEQAVALEEAGFRVERAHWFRRPSPLAPGTTAADWTRHFRAVTWASVPARVSGDLTARVDQLADERGLRAEDGSWVADYCRLRFVAIAA